MRAAFCGLVLMGLSGCVTVPQREAAPVAGELPIRPVAAVVQPQAPEPPAPSAVLRVPEMTRRESGGVVLEGVGFDSRSHRLVVADQPEGPGSRWADAASVMAAYHGVAALNAGFFTPEGKPLGRVEADGTVAGAWNRGSSLGSAVWLEEDSGAMSIQRRERVIGGAGARGLLQAGPLLVENGRAVAGLETTRSRVRSVILWDGGSRWWLGRASGCTLAALGKAVTEGKPAGWPVAVALNLDGGRSSDLAVAGSVKGGPVVRRAFWNRSVRNFLVLVAR